MQLDSPKSGKLRMIDEVQHRVQRVPAEDPEQGLFVFVNAPLNSARRLDREWITLASVVPHPFGAANR
ncbi:hypothetical protein ACW9HQ_24615 [Nocardia gipuzkoensis]